MAQTMGTETPGICGRAVNPTLAPSPGRPPGFSPWCAGWETALGRLWDGSGTAQYGCLRGTVIARQLKNFAAVAGHIPLPAQGYFSAFTSARVLDYGTTVCRLGDGSGTALGRLWDGSVWLSSWYCDSSTVEELCSRRWAHTTARTGLL
jgi:hypothetical protein